MKKIVLLFLFGALTITAQTNNGSLKVGDQAPLFKGIDQNGKSVNSENILKQNKILLVFYRGFWCPHCRKHLGDLQDHLNSFEDKGVKVIVVSPEKVEKTKSSADQLGAKFSIVHDQDNIIMNAYDVAFDVNKETVPKYYNIIQKKLKEYNDENNMVLPVPATYLIGNDGKILYAQYDQDYKSRSNFDDILSSL